jgi:opacity protein-like surface antigen
MKTLSALFLILAVALIGIAPSTALADKPSSYLVLKGGYYNPSQSFDLDAVHFNTKDGWVVEGAIGHYFLPFLAVEVGGGYLQTKTDVTPATADAKFKVVPLVATGKLLLPAGPIEPYGEFGVGLYIVDLDISGNGNTGTFSGSTNTAFGYHAGGGVNIDLGPVVFLGAEGRYLWIKRSYGPVDIKLDGFTVTGDLGFRF